MGGTANTPAEKGGVLEGGKCGMLLRQKATPAL